MTQQLFEAYQRIVKKHYGRTVTQDTFNKFVEYTKKGDMQNGVKPILNSINLYAFGLGITSEESKNIMFSNIGEENETQTT
ncbi:hypothetical protein [Streptococcus jiangjianxini]|uniref:hypothetical protein n=1 Tax=Streptococcus jiangjianxini TaxID=3161189 RepID=UPI0032EC2E93